jgi:hypothetical protein
MGGNKTFAQIQDKQLKKNSTQVSNGWPYNSLLGPSVFRLIITMNINWYYIWWYLV